VIRRKKICAAPKEFVADSNKKPSHIRLPAESASVFVLGNDQDDVSDSA
jgi:hypothetical protein